MIVAVDKLRIECRNLFHLFTDELGCDVQVRSSGLSHSLKVLDTMHPTQDPILTLGTVFKEFFQWPAFALVESCLVKSWDRMRPFLSRLVLFTALRSKLLDTVDRVLPHQSFHRRVSNY